MESPSTSSCLVCSTDVDSTVSVLGKRQLDSEFDDSEDECCGSSEEAELVAELSCCFDDFRSICRELYKLNAQMYGPLHGVVILFGAELRRLQNKSP